MSNAIPPGLGRGRGKRAVGSGKVKSIKEDPKGVGHGRVGNTEQDLRGVGRGRVTNTKQDFGRLEHSHHNA